MYRMAGLSAVVGLGLSVCVAQDTAQRALSLNESIRIALEESPYVVRIESERTQAAWGVLRTISPVLPHAALSSNAARSGPDEGVSIVEAPGVVGSLPVIAEELSRNEYATSISLSQSLIDVPVWTRIRQAVRARAAAFAAYRGSRAQLAYDVKQAYYRLVQLYRELAIAQAAVAQSEEQFRLAQARFDLGALGRPDLLRVEANLVQQRIEHIDAAASLEGGRRELANLLGVSSAVHIDTTLAFPELHDSIPSQDSLVELALRRNPSLTTAQATVEARTADRRAVHFDKVPTVSVSFTYGSADNAFWEQFSRWGENDFWHIAAYLRVGLINGGLWYARLRESSAEIARAQADARITRNGVAEQMRQAHAGLAAAREALSQVTLLTERAQEEYRFTLEKYRLGAASSLDLLTSQLASNRAARQAAEIVIRYRLARAQTLLLIGEW